MFSAQIAPIKNIVIDELMFIPMGEYKPMYIRPYTACVQNESLQSIIGNMQHTKLPTITPRDLVGLSKGLIYPSAVPVNSAVDGSWVGDKKFIFILKVTITDNFDTIHRYYLQGYTDHNGITADGNYANPQMILIVNTIIETYCVPVMTPYGVSQREKMDRVYNVVSNTDYQVDRYTQRPSDIYYNMESNNITQSLNKLTDFQGIGTTNDTRYTLSSADLINKTSEVINNIPSQYATTIINNGLRSMAILDSQNTVTEQSVAAVAINRVNDPDIKNNKFLKYLSMVNGQMRRYGTFSFGELTNIDPSINTRFKLLNITKDIVDVSLQSSPVVGEYWHGQDRNTIMAYSIIESSVSIATQFGFSKLYFTATNMYDATGAPYVIITYYSSILNLEEAAFNQLLDIFKTTFMDSVFLDETQGNAQPLTLNVYVDILGTSKVSIIDANGYEVWYTIPTFANSAFTPILTIDKANLDNLSYQVDNIINHVSAGTQFNRA